MDKMPRKIGLLAVVLAVLFFSASCAMPIDGKKPVNSIASARLLFYIHSTSNTPPDVRFTISGISVLSRGRGWVDVSNESIDIGAPELVRRQAFLKEAFIEPDLYSGIKFKVLSATIKGREGQASLALPKPAGEIVMDVDLKIKQGQSSVISIEWDPENSVIGGYQFQPAVTVEPQSPSARGLMLFVSNSGSDYISVIDRSLERVIGAVTVGEKPMGMALSSLQDRLYVVNAFSRDISIVDTARLEVIDKIPLVAGIEPADVVFMAEAGNQIDGKLYVTNRSSNDVTVLSTGARRILKSIKVGTQPSHIAADALRGEVYVANERSKDISIISSLDDTVAATIAVDSRPSGIAVGNNKIYVLNEGSNRVSIISPAQRKVVGTVSLMHAPRRAFWGLGGRLFIANTSSDTVTSLNQLDVIARTSRAGKGPVGLAGDELRSRLYITNYKGATVSVFDGVGEMVVKELSVGKNPYGAILLDR